MIRTVAAWLCKCGVGVKVLAESDSERPSAAVVAKCPNCGEPEEVYVHRIISVTAEERETLKPE